MLLRAIEFLLADEAKNYELGTNEHTLLDTASMEIIGLKNRLAATLRKNRWYDALQAHGVSDWEGYDEAMEQFREEEEYHD